MQDYHTHTTFSDGVDSVSTMVRAAAQAGITDLGISDHVRANTTWLPAYVDEIHRVRNITPIRVRIGVEAKILDTHGNLDLPDDLDGIEYVAIADHRVPTRQGPVHPETIAAELEAGSIAPVDVMEMVVSATVNAALTAPVRPIIAHLFSIMPKIGLRAEYVPLPLVQHLARGLAGAGAAVEINEKWRCPTGWVAGRLAAAGVDIVAGSDSHAADRLGKYSYVGREGSRLIPALSAA